MANKTKQKDVVCPRCYKQIHGAAVRSKRADRYGRKVRTYYGWCQPCNSGFEVVQFAAFAEFDGVQHLRWKIHTYQRYIKSESGSSRPAGPTVTVCELPDVSPVVTGPGGDYDTPWPAAEGRYWYDDLTPGQQAEIDEAWDGVTDAEWQNADGTPRLDEDKLDQIRQAQVEGLLSNIVKTLQSCAQSIDCILRHKDNGDQVSDN